MSLKNYHSRLVQSIVANVTGKLNRPNSSLFLGKGKAEEVRDLVEELCAELVIINHELSPSQRAKFRNVLWSKGFR